MAHKRKTLPKDFEALCRAGDLDALKAMFARCELDAYGGYYKAPAPCFPDCPDELIRWLVAQGSSVNASDRRHQSTPLLRRVMAGRDLTLLLELGADVNAANCYGVTPLHAAVRHPETVRILLAHGAQVNVRSQLDLTPLETLLIGPPEITAATMETIRLLRNAGATSRFPLPDPDGQTASLPDNRKG